MMNVQQYNRTESQDNASGDENDSIFLVTKIWDSCCYYMKMENGKTLKT